MDLVVTLNKVCKLRSSRGADSPSLESCITHLAAVGCNHLLLHRWPDERHVTVDDLIRVDQHPDIRSGRIAFRVGGYLDRESLEIVSGLSMVESFVATPFDAAHRTTQRGWSSTDSIDALVEAREYLGENVRFILFVDPEPEAVSLATAVGAHALEVNCRALIRAPEGSQQHGCRRAVELIVSRAREARFPCGLAHDIGGDWLERLQYLRTDWITVGHSFVADSVVAGLQSTFQRYLTCAGGN